MTCQPQFFKGFLLTCNIFLLVAGIAFVTVGLLIKDSQDAVKSARVISVFFKVFTGLIGVGLSICFISLLGCFGTFFQVFWMLMLHSILIILIMISELALIIIFLTTKSQVTNMLESYANSKCKKDCSNKLNVPPITGLSSYWMPIIFVLIIVLTVQFSQLICALKLAKFIQIPKAKIDLQNLSKLSAGGIGQPGLSFGNSHLNRTIAVSQIGVTNRANNKASTKNFNLGIPSGTILQPFSSPVIPYDSTSNDGGGVVQLTTAVQIVNDAQLTVSAPFSTNPELGRHTQQISQHGPI